MGCIDNDKFYVYSLNTKQEKLFDYRSKSTVDVINEHLLLADSMRVYSASQLLSFRYLHKNNKIRIVDK
jgi:hypothetical protein